MDETPNSTDRIRAILVLLATLGTIIFNVLAATGYVNGVTPDVISNKYPTVLTPAGYAFSIWSLIYLGMAAFSVFQLLPPNRCRFRPVRSVYILSCVLNCAWIYFWHRDQIGICLIIIFTLLAALILLLVQFRRPGSTGGTLFTTTPFGIYAGWVTAATIVNFVIFLKYEGVELSNNAWTVLGIVLIALAAALAMLVRWKLKNYLYPLGIAWALTAIAVSQGGNTAIIMAAAFGVVICMVTTGSFVVDLKDSTSE